MFKLQPKPTFKCQVSIPSPDGEGKLTVVFKHKGKKDLQEFFKSLTEGDNLREDADALMDLMDSWEGVDAEFSRDNLETLLDNYPGAAAAFMTAYSKALNEGRTKN